MPDRHQTELPPPPLEQLSFALEALAELFDRDPPLPRRLPLDELLLTLLSQNTNDVNRDRAWHSLRAAFPTWEEVLAAPEESIEERIRVAGLAPTRTRRMKAVLAEIRRREGSLDLARLETLPLEEALDSLLSLPGIGRKTAACVLLFCFGKPVMPVDTHIERVTKRLGWAPEKATPDQISRLLGSSVPSERLFEFHINLISLGRSLCKAPAPLCDKCPLAAFCLTA